MELLDSRRLTGPNLYWNKLGAIIEVCIDDTDPRAIESSWQKHLQRMLDALNWGQADTLSRQFPDFLALVFAAPLDALYAATEVNEWAFAAMRDELCGVSDAPDFAAESERLKTLVAEEQIPALVNLVNTCHERGIAMHYDDEWASVGLGKYSITWPVHEIPAVDDIDWSRLGNVPIGFITGTNGKTTTVRLSAAIAMAAGLTPGVSSTDWIAVGNEVLDKGDYSGPGGARRVLQDSRVDIGILEAARGGLIRRGLALQHADCAVITNIAEDHMGESGVHDLATLAEVKWVVTQVLSKNDTLVLNAEDPLLAERGKNSKFNICFYACDASCSTLVAHMKAGGRAMYVEHGIITWFDGRSRSKLIAVKDVPLTLGGAAIHNVSNALAAAAFTLQLGISASAIVSGLKNTRSDANPGRGNLYRYKGAQFLVDFAHNLHGLDAIFATIDAIQAKRKLVLLGQAGDRSDDAIRDLVRKVWSLNPDFVIIKEMAEYARGRAKGEVPDIIKKELMLLGADESRFTYIEKEIDAAKFAVDWAQKDDLALLLVHGEKEAVADYFAGLKSSAND